MRIVRACAEVETYVRLCADILGKHIDGSTKSASTVGRSTYTTLNLHALKVWGKVCHVYPEELWAFSITLWHTIWCDIDARRVGTTHTQSGIADAITCIRSCGDWRSQGKDIRNILSEVNTFDLALVEIRESHWCVLASTSWCYLNILQHHSLSCIYRLYCIKICCTSKCSEKEYISFHVYLKN